MTARERFFEVTESLKLTDYRIYTDIEAITKNMIVKLRKGEVEEVSTKILVPFCLAFPKVNANYILTGNGEMFNEEHDNAPVKTLPRIPYDAAAGSLTDAMEGVKEIQCERSPVVAAFPKYDFTIRVAGRSMEPIYFSGDEVACLRVNESRFLQWGRVYVLDTAQGVIIKRIYENGESIRCSSFNPEYPDFNVPKEDIFSYNLVVGALRL